jgi:hypothetical protein
MAADRTGPRSADVRHARPHDSSRRTDRERSTTLLYFDHEGRRWIVASFAGVDQHPAWYLNLLDDPHVTTGWAGS